MCNFCFYYTENMKTKIIVFSIFYSSVFGLPQEISVESGSALVRRVEEHTMHIQTSEKTILNCQSFDVALGEKVVFFQPSSSSCVLSRIKGAKASEILGQIESN